MWNFCFNIATPNLLHFIHLSAMLMSKRLAYKSGAPRWPDSDNTTVAQQERQIFVIALRFCPSNTKHATTVSILCMANQSFNYKCFASCSMISVKRGSSIANMNQENFVLMSPQNKKNQYRLASKHKSFATNNEAIFHTWWTKKTF